MTIHWCGTGLSSIPGLRRLLEEGQPVVVWNRTPEKAREAVGDLAKDIRPFSLEALSEALEPGDVAVSMLPGDWHVAIAEACLAKGAHFVSSSYISPEMRALDAAARDKGLSFVNEVGLDPGIDHLMAHKLVEEYRASDAYDAGNEISFLSYCGGVPKIANAFRYKFSWAPAGVLKALRSPSRSIRNFAELNVSKPWDAISTYTAPLPTAEDFEVYPNRDSLPFIEQYHFAPEWKVRDFVRGTLRLNGWADAWSDIFAEVGTASDARIEEIAAKLLAENAYEEDEPDRVILCVSLKAERDGETKWHKTYVMDAWGDARGTAMARLVSVPVSLAIKSVLAREIPAGVSAAPSDPKLVEAWLGEIDTLAQHMQIVDEA
ncbi:saccharopine dehydrogenase family protein [Rhodalgimonas zhirmunskyi]|uniref:Saccharopine dehydrogenase NADP-binding domain-containing protein n=1 Tax=Rhodalgimonas zhirmunskyi TaxID=2964767 RepID=A0AAJ1UC18_9RHOB|nr:saccharopine dehydrogenase family protein [Rhodoalgimonas zhirmunskyi]MDQ2095113.1 saccharopine dehydrogenase NADP-binding domain-containing protein [Rhodoalgimonas zhirmunskyi]